MVLARVMVLVRVMVLACVTWVRLGVRSAAIQEPSGGRPE